MEGEREEYKHPAFGQISFSRISTTGENFYGSELEQDHYISMEVHNSCIERELTQDRYYNTGPILLKLRMSSGQFSELITSMNMGEGIPCTIERFNGKLVEELPKQESRKEFVHRKFEDRMTQFAQRLKEKQQQAKEIVKKKTLSKDDVRDLSFHLEWLTQEISGNIPFFAKCFQETMDEVVYEAKLEVENAIQHKINVLGLDELHKQNKLLSD